MPSSSRCFLLCLLCVAPCLAQQQDLTHLSLDDLAKVQVSVTQVGVYWDALDIPPENIDRVEVIRGPGGTLWGANAVNGVINIVTKSADQAQGAMVEASIDKDEGYTTTLRYGGGIGPSANYL